MSPRVHAEAYILPKPVRLERNLLLLGGGLGDVLNGQSYTRTLAIASPKQMAGGEHTRGQARPQLLGLFRVFEGQGVEVPRASDLELGDRLGGAHGGDLLGGETGGLRRSDSDGGLLHSGG